MDKDNRTNEIFKKIEKHIDYEILTYIIGIIIVILCLALTFALSAWIFNAVMASDMPDWLKYVLLK
jgi:hypothetical protein